MIEILNRWTRAVVYHAETAQTIAEAVLEARKNSADLRGAKGILPNGVVPLQILGIRHPLIVREVGHITIGCQHHSVEWREEHYRALGRTENYTREQVNEYRDYIALARYWMNNFGVLEVPK